MNRASLFLVLAVAIIVIPAIPAGAEIVTRTLRYEIDGAVHEGFLAYDDALDGRQPGVLVVHEWWGLNDFARGKARELAELGYVAFAADMYGKDVLAETPEKADELAHPFYADGFVRMRRHARAAFNVLSKQPNVNADRIGAIGLCFGGTSVLQLAYSGAPVKGVVSFHGSLPAPAESDDDDITASILVLHGADDPFVPKEMVDSFTTAMQRAEVDWQFVTYGNAVHSFTNPGVDRYELDGAKYNEKASRRSWEHMQVFFDEVLRSR